MSVFTSAGCTVAIGPTTAAANAAAYAALSYDALGEVEEIGEFGDQVGTTTFTSIADRRVRKCKTTFDAGEISLTLGRDATDTGQAAAIAALAADDDYAFQVELNDSGGTSPTTLYFHAKVTGYTTNIGSAEGVVKASLMLAINTAIFEAAAA